MKFYGYLILFIIMGCAEVEYKRGEQQDGVQRYELPAPAPIDPDPNDSDPDPVI